MGFIWSKYDTCLYFKHVRSVTPLYILLYVDDILLISSSKSEIAGVKHDLKKHFDMKDLGPAQKILGVKITRDRSKKVMRLSQIDYLHKVLDRFSMLNSKPAPIPLGGHLKLSKSSCPTTVAEIEKMRNVPYDVAVGSVMYAMLCTRPDLAFAISILSRYMSNPGEKHWATMKYCLKYISGSRSVGLVYSEHKPRTQLQGYVDSNYAGNKNTRKSTTAYFYTWDGNCVSWKVQQQSIIALSSTEAEYIAAVEASKEATWMKGILKEITGKVFVLTLNMDSQSALYLCKDPVYHEKTKHIDVRLHYIRDEVEKQQLNVLKILGDENPTDFGTKVVPTNKFLFLQEHPPCQ